MKQRSFKKVSIFISLMFFIFMIARSLDLPIIPQNGLYSNNVILLPLDSQQAAYVKNEDEQIAPASLTKIMSAIIVIEQCSSLQEMTTITKDTMQTMMLNNASIAGYQENEEASVLDLLYGLLLSSGGECGLTLAKEIAGSEENFVALMNDKAKELQLTNTHYTNVNGFDNINHYSSVKDIAKILQYALKNPTFYTIFTSFQYTSSSTAYHPNGLSFTSTLLSDTSLAIPNGTILGGKTGFTDNAGLCLASLAKIKDTTYILVSTNAKGDHSTKPYHILDALTIYKNL
jgi:D-alanyl-D-alanine carboxypeptidase (penicillin-binding protein 5/6)